MGRQRKRDRRPIHLLKPGEELKSESQKRQRRDGDRENPRGPSQGASSNRTGSTEGAPAGGFICSRFSLHAAMT